MLIINCIKEKNDYFSSSFSLACIGQKYEEVLDNAYLTFELSEKNLIKTIIIDKEIDGHISQSNVNDIIGIHVIMNIPQKEIEERHLNMKEPDLAWKLFEAGLFDNYCEVVDVSFVNEN